MRTPETRTVVRLQRAIGALIDELVDAVDAGEAGDPENPTVLSMLESVRYARTQLTAIFHALDDLRTPSA